MARSARFGGVSPGTEGFSINWDVRDARSQANKMIALINQLEQKFRGATFQYALSEANGEIAEEVQKGMRAELRREVKRTGRKQRGTNYLEMSIMDERNVQVTATQGVVGLESWLDQSPAALYWRQIEYGNPKVYNWRGLFTNDFKKWYGPTPGGKHMRMPQFKGYLAKGALMEVGPFPQYEFSAGGVAAYERMNIFNRYEKHLARAGFDIKAVTK